MAISRHRQNDMAVDIVYETHALTEDNVTGTATGWLPGRLSERGRQMAEQLGERRRNDGINTVFVSDLARAVETADIAFMGTSIPIIRDARLRECNYGDLNGAPLAQIDAQRARHIDEPWPGGQSYRHVLAQMSGFLEELTNGWDGQRVLVIGHAATRWALDCLIDGRPIEELVAAPFGWQPGWEYVLPDGWKPGQTAS